MAIQASGSSTTSPATPTAAPPSNVSSLEQFLQEAAVLLVHLVQLQSQNTQNMDKYAGQLVGFSQQQAQEAADNAQKVADMIYEMNHQSIWQKILGDIMGPLLTLIGALTSDPALMIIGLTMTVMNASGGQQALNNALSNLSPALQGLVQMSIAVGAAILTAGAAGALEAASATAGDLGGAAAADVAAGAAADGAAAGGDAGAAAGADAGAVAGNGAADVAEDQSFLSKAFENGFTKGKIPGGAFLSTLGQETMMFNPWVGFTEAALEKAGVGKDQAEMIAGIIGAILAVISGGLGSAAGATGDTSAFVAKLTEKLGQDGMKLVTRAVKLVAAAVQASAGGLSISIGINEMKQADLMSKQGEIQSNQMMFDLALDTINSTMTMSNASMKSTMSQFNNMNTDINGMLEPYAYAAESMI